MTYIVVNKKILDFTDMKVTLVKYVKVQLDVFLFKGEIFCEPTIFIKTIFAKYLSNLEKLKTFDKFYENFHNSTITVRKRYG